MRDETLEQRGEFVAEAESAPPPAPAPPPSAGAPSDAGRDEALAAELRRATQQLEQIRGLIESHAREDNFRDVSIARLIGAVLQAIVVGWVAAGLADWLFAAERDAVLVKLAFAAVFQLGALTAFVLVKSESKG